MLRRGGSTRFASTGTVSVAQRACRLTPPKCFANSWPFDPLPALHTIRDLYVFCLSPKTGKNCLVAMANALGMGATPNPLATPLHSCQYQSQLSISMSKLICPDARLSLQLSRNRDTNDGVGGRRAVNARHLDPCAAGMHLADRVMDREEGFEVAQIGKAPDFLNGLEHHKTASSIDSKSLFDSIVSIT